jgi:type II secretory pathway pseudopilin PulG
MNKKAAFIYLELVMIMGVLAIMFAAFLAWQQGFVRQMRDVQNYYQERQIIFNRLARGDYDRTEQRDGYKYNEIIWRGKRLVRFSL